MRALLLAFAISLVSSVALADAMPDCPSGQHLEENPVQPGAMHHAGGQCIDDPGGCSVSPAARASVPAWITVIAIAIGIRGALRRRA